MVKIPEYFNIGNRDSMQIEDLLLILERMYTDLAVALNGKVDLVQREVDGQTSDTFLDQGTVNINLLTNKVEMLTNHLNTTNVTWTQLS